MPRFAPIAAALLGLAAALLPVAAVAGEARASGNVPVHRGPGSGYAVIGNLSDGAAYEVEDCTRQARWCLVSDAGDELGWVEGSYLVGSGAKLTVTPFELLYDPFDRDDD